jgi:hypothetical protein
VLVREQHAIELLGRDAALLQPNDNLPRAQSAIDQNFAVISGEEGGIPGAAAAEHGETEHVSYLATARSISQMESRYSREKFGNARMRFFLAA